MTIHKPIRQKTTIVLVLTFVLMFSATAFATGVSSARSVGMGAAYTSLADGIDAARFNPANLGLSSHRYTGIELVGVGANINNNSFTLNDYNTYTGAFLTSEDKDYILSKIPEEGLKFHADAEASAMGVSMGSWALTMSGHGLAEINLNRDVIDLVLNGNTYADTIDFTGSFSEALAYGSAGLSYGMPIYKSGSRIVSIGATAKYLYGFAIERAVKMEGMAATFAAGFEGQGELVFQTATGGSGYALDLGAAIQLNETYTVGAKIENFISNFTWDQETEEHGYLFNFDTMTVDNMGADYITSDDYSVPIESFSTDLPSTMTIGIAKIQGKLLWAADWEQGFSSKTGVSTKPRFSAGAEWLGLGFFPVRAGFATGGIDNTAFSFGGGFHIPVFYLDFAVVTGNSLSGYSSKGANVALTAGLRF